MADGEVLGYSVGAALAAIAKDFTQIPLDPNAPLIPYEDLQAQGAYGRGLILPDDIYPVLNHMALTGSKNGAKLATGANVDGAQDVYVVNQSGGGGVASIVGLSATSTYWALADAGGLGIVANVDPVSPATILASIVYTIRPDPANAPPAGQYCDWRVIMIGGGGAGFVTVALGRFHSDDYVAPVPIAQGPFVLNPAVQLGGTFGGSSGLEIWAEANPGGIVGVVVPNYGV